MKPLKKDLGSYMPAFFYMKLSFPICDTYDLLGNLSEENLSIFIHEYIHFIQDISTHVGLNNSYVHSEYTHGIVNLIYKLRKGLIRLPLNIPKDYGNLKLNEFVNDVGMGTFGICNDFFLNDIDFERVTAPYANPYVNQMTKIVMISAKQQKEEFGYRAIMESMAYLMEKNIAKGCKGAPDYPYHAAEMVANYYYPEFAEDDLRLIALCDACMQFSESGRIFVETINKFKSEHFLPGNANEIIDYFYDKTCVQLGQTERIDIGLMKMGFAIGEQIKDYMNHPSFKPFHNVIHSIFGFGLRERLLNRYFMLDIVRNGVLPNNKLIRRYMNEVGTPIMIDKNENYWMIPPFGQTPETYWMEYIPAIEQIYLCLVKGQSICELIPWCEKSPGTQIDNRCYEKPWSRCNDLKKCPYAMLWEHWGLSNYMVAPSKVEI